MISNIRHKEFTPTSCSFPDHCLGGRLGRRGRAAERDSLADPGHPRGVPAGLGAGAGQRRSARLLPGQLRGGQLAGADGPAGAERRRGGGGGRGVEGAALRRRIQPGEGGNHLIRCGFRTKHFFKKQKLLCSSSKKNSVVAAEVTGAEAKAATVASAAAGN